MKWLFGWWLNDFLTLIDRLIDRMSGRPETAPVTVPQPQTPPEPVEPPAEPVKQLSWDNPVDAFKLTRIMCDEQGLTLEQKDIVCACVYQESRFYNRRSDGSPLINENKKDGKVWSTDYGIAQVNDYWHIGPGKSYPSVEYVMANPDKMIRWMVMEMKRTGKLQPWSSFVTGAYKVWLRPESPMWHLKR